MNQRIRKRTADRLAVGLLVLWVSAQQTALAADRALLIGINDYVDQRISDLRGCEKDVEAMRRLLVDDYGFDVAHIRMLQAKAATRQGILAAIDQWLVQGTGEGDRVLLYYSGHGSQKKCPRTKPHEPDGFDEILCPVDYNPETQANCILDDEIAFRLAQLDGRDVVVIVDACHSGSITKSIGGRFRSVETIDTAQSVPKYIPPPAGATTRNFFFRPPTHFAANSPTHAGAGQVRSNSSDATNATSYTEQIIDEVRANYVALTSCADAQTSEEIRVRVGSQYARRGAFTWTLVEGLAGPADRNADGRITYREILAYVHQRLRDPRYDLTQTPELRTRPAFMDQPFLGRILASGGLGKVVAVSGDRVTINRGAQHGVSQAQVYEVAGDRKTTEDGEIQIAVVEEFLAEGRLKGPISVRPGDPIRPKDIFYNPDNLTVWLAPMADGGDARDDLRVQVRARLLRHNDITLVDDPAAAERTVKVEERHGRLSASIYSRYGTLRSQKDYGDIADLTEGIANRLLVEALIMQLSQLEKRSGDLDLRLWVNGGRSTFIAYRDRNKRESIRFGFRASRSCYVTLISIDSSGELRANLLGDQPLFVRAAQDCTLPRQDKDPLRVLPPPGRDVIYALATSRSFDTRGIGTKSIREHGTAHVLDVIIKAIGNRQEKTDATPALAEVARLTEKGWAVVSISIDALPEE